MTVRTTSTCILLALVLAATALAGPGSPPEDGVFGPVHPNYSTSLRVQRTRVTWDQRMLVSHALDSLRTTANLGSSVARDEAVNDTEHYRSDATGSIIYGVDTRPFRSLIDRLEFGATLDLDRAKQLSASSAQRRTTDTYSLTLDASRPVGMGFRAFADARAGVTEIESRTDTRSTMTRNASTQTGPSWSVGGALSNHAGNRSPRVEFDIGFSNDSFQQTTDDATTVFTDEFQTVASVRDTTFEQNNLNRSFDMAVASDVTSWLTSSFNAVRTIRDEVTPNTQTGRTEDLDSTKDRADFEVQLAGPDDLTLTLDYGITDESTDADQSTLNKDENGSSLGARAGVLWFGIDTDLTVSSDRTETSYKDVFDGDVLVSEALQGITTELNKFDITMRRDLNQQVSLTAKSNLSRREAVYVIDPTDDEEVEFGVSKLDRDSREWINDLTIDYEPMKVLKTSLSLGGARKRVVSVHPTRSGNTNTETELKVTATYTFTGIPGYRLEQDVSVSAKSRVFDFTDADQSDLNRTTELTTRIDADILPATVLELEHLYNFRSLGQYADEDGDGVRLFALTRESLEQTLKVGVQYSPYDWLDFGGRQTLRVVETRVPGRDDNRITRYDLELRGSFDRTLMESVNTSLSVSRFLSTQEEFYWKITASANRTF